MNTSKIKLLAGLLPLTLSLNASAAPVCALPAPDTATITVEFAYPPAKPEPDADPERQRALKLLATFRKVTKIELATSGSVGLETRVYSDGQTFEFWRCGELRLHRHATGGEQIYTLAPAGADREWPSLNWLTADTYRGIQTLQGRKYHVYQNQEWRALADLETGYPRRLESSELTVTYSYAPPPNPPLQLPPQLTEALPKLRKVMFGVE